MSVAVLGLAFTLLLPCGAILYPKASSTRLVMNLDGIWNFKLENMLESREEQWHKNAPEANGITYLMPVPSSFNDITQNETVRDFIGDVYYYRNFWVPDYLVWNTDVRFVLRIGAAHYYTTVWFNDNQFLLHEGGHLPFETQLDWYFLQLDSPNQVVLSVNNALTPHTLPPANWKFYNGSGYPPGGVSVMTGQFDFFNYAGIHQSVLFYGTPKVYIDDIKVITTLRSDGSADIHYTIYVGGVYSNSTTGICAVTLEEPHIYIYNTTRIKNGSTEGTLNVKYPILWWPWTMNETAGMMYPFEVNCTDRGISDIYRLAIGLREIKIDGTQFLVNGKPFYFNGINRHEDWDTVGKGIYEALVAKDINLLKWLGVAVIRSSNYPYAEEFLDLCDKAGIVVIGETTAVGQTVQENFDEIVLQKHIMVITEMYNRDKNRPSIFMWSLAGEPDSTLSVARPYFKKLVEVMHTLDPTRPVTFACSQSYGEDLVTQYMDVIMINHFYGWNEQYGHPELVPGLLAYDLDQWYMKHGKPIIVSEYGAGSISGLHKNPPVMWSEEYQANLLMAYWGVFDEYRKKYLIGELIWTFADFETSQDPNRVDRSRKGLLTRQRQPKMAAYAVRKRYMALAQGQDYHPENVFAK